ncbi:MAG: ribonuclease III, partial [Alphaproteobacteria bacterium]
MRSQDEEEMGPEGLLEGRLGHAFADRELLRTALTHRSHTAGPGAQNETLEFLGDAVLGLVVTELLVRAWPRVGEGRLTRRRASLVSATSLAHKAAALGIGEFLLLGRGEEKTRGREKPSILAGALEAILGSVFLDGGFDAARAVVERLFLDDVSGIEPPPYGGGEFKTQLQEIVQRDLHAAPEYSLSSTTGPDHAREFHVEVSVEGRILGRGSGSSKKIAESAAAREAVARLRGEPTSPEAGNEAASRPDEDGTAVEP